MNFYNRYFDEEKVSVQHSSFGNLGEVDEHHLMLLSEDESSDFNQQLTNIQLCFEKLTNKGELAGVTIVFKRYFLSDAANQYAFLNLVESADNNYAVSAVQQPPLNGSKVALWIYLVKDVSMENVDSYFIARRNGYQHIWVAQLHGHGDTSFQQTDDIFINLEEYLTAQACSLKDNCIRTWFFVNNVDVNYSGVVEARKAFFNVRDMIPQTHYISSTGIEGRNNNPHALVIADAYSVKGLQKNQMKFLKASNHMNPTFEYGVTFERGTIVDYGDRRHILISGTASINDKGEIVYPNNVLQQAGRAMQNIEALLLEAQAGINDIAQMIIYLRDIADSKTIDKFFQTYYPAIPKVLVLAPVCRPGWLVEIECMAISKQQVSEYQNF